MRKVTRTFLLPGDEEAIAVALLTVRPTLRFIDGSAARRGQEYSGIDGVESNTLFLWDPEVTGDKTFSVQWMRNQNVAPQVLREGRFATEYESGAVPRMDTFVKDVWRVLKRNCQFPKLMWPDGATSGGIGIGNHAYERFVAKKLSLRDGAMPLRPAGDV
ncbi:hypothetical protein Val02_82890 [Virgisporangium aliadipatigenens]|uniref:Uncharacterized protein n=1 Tax=Virgisporangium aliadipatigenens TaxID=741659 RepID=A0A8J4DVP7_9ACTN|nr:hypothetical protein [Virgisporangium aliadipatigenens]GIJ51403.1 hypothetical protein Val02_82890 [Virgisporangium aliadipatigenens]